MDQHNPNLQTLEQIRELTAQFEERAEAVDVGGPGNALLEKNVRALAATGFYGARIPVEYGGLGLDSETNAECQELIASACGVTAFTQQQLHSGGHYVGQSANVDVKRDLLPKFSRGEVLCGIAFSHLRRPGPPLVRVERIADGVLVNGEAPWVTGWRFLDSFSLGAVAPDGRIVYVYVSIPDHAKTLSVSEPIRVSTMDAGDTVRVFLRNVVIPEKYVLFEREPDFQTRADFNNIAGPVHLPLGCARGCARHLRLTGQQRKRPLFVEAADHFEAEVDLVRDLARSWSGDRAAEPEYKERALAARAGAIRLAMRASEACIAANSGAAHLLTNPAQRRHREASFYATVAQTPDIQATFIEAVTYGK
ncbi:MAG: acyl-CoA/acyl-ACP dehydrogenase [Capsulimonadaceae bacterium]|nr:acyl-CoA/acyl-ACP dehydrogenase [Capsulimonadaceae bacterium]